MIDSKMRPEILAPCGSYDILIAAVAAGADACYIGGNKYGARAYAENFDTDSIISAIDYAHLHDTKLYLTVNTLFKQNEILDLYEYLKPYYEAGLDAVIVQDLGVFELIKEYFPDINIHCSTQMNINSCHGARFMYSRGASRVVTAREMPLTEIAKIKEQIPGLEVETFVHGAMCYSYSGQCLLSSLAGGRSGNRGRCAQPCRKQYGNNYLLSMKDMCSIEHLPHIIDAGIDSIKIEGRMKNAYYVASAVGAYKEIRDSYIEGSFNIKEAERLKFKLANVFNRGGFCDGYFFVHNDSKMISKDRPNNQGVIVGKLTKVGNGTVNINLCCDLYKGDVLELKLNNTNILEITSGIDGKSGKIVTLNAPKTKYILNNQDVYRTRCNHILDDIHRDFLQENAEKKNKHPLRFKLEAKLGEAFVAEVSCKMNGKTFSASCRTGIVEQSERQKPDINKIKEKLNQIGNTDYYFEDIVISVDTDAFVPMGLVKQLRRDAIATLEEKITGSYRRELNPIPTVDNKVTTTIDNPVLKSEIKLRISALEQLEAVMKYIDKLNIYGIYLDLSLFNQAEEEGIITALNKKGVKIYLELPYIIDSRFEPSLYLPKDLISGIYIRNIDGFAALQEYIKYCDKALDIVCASSLYAYNQVARSFLCSDMSCNITFELPLELNLKELSALPGCKNEYFIYGYQQVMLSNQCLRKTTKGCNHGNEVVKITDDRGNSFYGKCFCDSCFNVIYNGKATCMLNKLDEVKELIAPDYIKLEFNIEDKRETCNVLNMLYCTVIEHDTSLINLQRNMYTTGYSYRGVE